MRGYYNGICKKVISKGFEEVTDREKVFGKIM